MGNVVMCVFIMLKIHVSSVLLARHVIVSSNILFFCFHCVLCAFALFSVWRCLNRQITNEIITSEVTRQYMQAKLHSLQNCGAFCSNSPF